MKLKRLKILIIPLLIVTLFCFGMNSFASLHSKWSGGDLIFYDGATNIWTIRDGTDGVKVYDDLNLTFGTDNDATIEYDEDGTNKLILTCSGGFTLAGALGFTGDILMATTSKIQFHDVGMYINATSDGNMAISSDGTLAVGATTSYTLTSPAVKFIATTSVIHELDASNYVTQTIGATGLVTVTTTGDAGGSYEIVADDTTIVLDANTTISLEAGVGTYGFSATTLDMNALTITDVGDIETTNAAGPTLQNEAVTVTNPTLIPNRADETTGIGWHTAEIHIVISGVDDYDFSATALDMNSNNLEEVGTYGGTGGITITPGAAGTFLDFVLETEWVSGTLINVDFGAGPTTFSSAVIGMNLDLGANVAATSEQSVKALDINLPQMTVSDAAITAIGIEITATGAFAQTVGSASTWSGIEITTPTISEDTGTIVSTGVKITGGTLTSGNAYGVVLAGALTKAVYINGTIVTGIDIGTCTSYGILMDDTYVNAIRITTNVDTTAQTSVRVLNTYTANSGYHTAIMGAAILDSTAGTGSGAVIGVYGEANIQDAFTGATNWSYGVRGCLQLNDNTDLDNVGSIFGAINAVLKDNPTPTITNAHIAGIYIDNLIDFDLSSATGISAMIYSANNASATCTMDYNWYIYGPKVTYLLGIYDGTVSGCVSETTNNEKHGGTIRHLKLDIDGTPYYLIISTTPTT